MYISLKLLWMSNWKFKLRKLSNLLGQTTTRVSQQSNKCTRMSKFCNTLKVHHGRTIFFSVISDDHSCYIFFWLNAVEWYCSSSGVGSTSWFSDSGRRGLVDPALIAHVGGCGQGGCVTSLWEGCVTFIAHSWPETIVIKSVVRSQGWQRADANAISKEDLSCSINPCSSIFQLWEVNLKIWIPNCSEFCHWETNCPWVMNSFSHSRRLSSLNIDWIFSDHLFRFLYMSWRKSKTSISAKKARKNSKNNE